MTNYVLVHGSFVGGWNWRETAALLEKGGHQVHVVEQMPSAGRDPARLGDLCADADCVRQVVEAVGEPVVLVGHLYGGMVITELADHPSVAHTVYLSAFWPQRGRSVSDMLCDLGVARQALCADLDLDRAAEELRRLLPQSMSSLGSRVLRRTASTPRPTSSARRTTPSRSPLRSRCRSGRPRRTLPSSHQPVASMPDKLAEVLARVR